MSISDQKKAAKKHLKATSKAAATAIQNEISEIGKKISEISKKSPGPLTPAEEIQIDELFSTRKRLADSMIRYGLVGSINLNDPTNVKQLADTIAAVNDLLNKRMKHLSGIVKGFANLQGFAATLDAALKAALALTKIV